MMVETSNVGLSAESEWRVSKWGCDPKSRIPRWCWPPLIYRAKHSRNVFLCHTYTMELCNIQWRWSYCYSVLLAWLLMIDRIWVSSTLGCTCIMESECPPRSIAHDWQTLGVLLARLHMIDRTCMSSAFGCTCIMESECLPRLSAHPINFPKRCENAFYCYRHYRNAYHCYKRCRNVLLCYKYNQWHAWVH